MYKKCCCIYIYTDIYVGFCFEVFFSVGFLEAWHALKIKEKKNGNCTDVTWLRRFFDR